MSNTAPKTQQAKITIYCACRAKKMRSCDLCPTAVERALGRNMQARHFYPGLPVSVYSSCGEGVCVSVSNCSMGASPPPSCYRTYSLIAQRGSRRLPPSSSWAGLLSLYTIPLLLLYRNYYHYRCYCGCFYVKNTTEPNRTEPSRT